MVIKDVLQQILDENWVETDKVGINTVYWSFPGQAGVQRKRKIDALSDEKAQLAKKVQVSRQEAEKEAQGKEDSDERKEILAKLQVLMTENEQLKSEAKKFSAYDPERLDQIRAQAEVALEAANRWTDNLWALKKYCGDKFNIDGNAFDRAADIVIEDYLES
eukprot:c11751_g1_i1.p1 GENE.c11751_g1_i1~~c11751_g1_i1.p1  ORF type:complete len:162 (+),score=34.91 c11751_g1_i1:309-794(+)